MPLNLYNTLTKRHEPLVPIDPSHVTFYSCGPTVYDDAHIGNFRSFLAADVLRRFIESPLCELQMSDGTIHRAPQGRKVTHVMNITDVGHMTDDADGGENGEDRMSIAGKRLEEAKKAGKLPPDVKVDPNDPYQVARFYEDRFKDDARKLGLKLALDAQQDATLMPRATESIAGMIAVISRLMSRGHAYVTGNPGSRVVYFDVKSFETYGSLSGNTLNNLKEGEGGRVNASNQATKKHPADFLLWKEDATHVMKWDSPWGKGYPGWHIECTAMSVTRLLSNRGPGASPGVAAAHDTALDLSTLLIDNGNPLIDLHSGGEDNIFPHHECEIAQSCCAFNAEPGKGSFAKMWFHPRFLLVEGTKMSKSKGNFYTVRDLMPGGRVEDGFESAAVRLELIKTHYRSNANFTLKGLKESSSRIARWRNHAAAVREYLMEHPHGDVLFPPVAGQISVVRKLETFVTALEQDLNIGLAISVMDGYATLNPKNKVDPWRTLPQSPMPLNEALKAYGVFEENSLNKEWAAIHLIDAVLGVIFVPHEVEASTVVSDIGLFAPGVTPDPAVEALLRQRRDARAAKDFKASDAIRDQLAAMGYAIKDAKDGKVEVSRKG